MPDFQELLKNNSAWEIAYLSLKLRTEDLTNSKYKNGNYHRYVKELKFKDT